MYDPPTFIELDLAQPSSVDAADNRCSFVVKARMVWDLAHSTGGGI